MFGTCFLLNTNVQKLSSIRYARKQWPRSIPFTEAHLRLSFVVSLAKSFTGNGGSGTSSHPLINGTARTPYAVKHSVGIQANQLPNQWKCGELSQLSQLDM